jgi:hypothetical protein
MVTTVKQYLSQQKPENGKYKDDLSSVYRIRIRRIRKFLDFPEQDPDPVVRGTDPDPDPSNIKQKYWKHVDINNL